MRVYFYFRVYVIAITPEREKQSVHSGNWKKIASSCLIAMTVKNSLRLSVQKNFSKKTEKIYSANTLWFTIRDLLL